MAMEDVQKVELLPDNKCRIYFRNDDLAERIVRKSAEKSRRLYFYSCRIFRYGQCIQTDYHRILLQHYTNESSL